MSSAADRASRTVSAFPLFTSRIRFARRMREKAFFVSGLMCFSPRKNGTGLSTSNADPTQTGKKIAASRRH
jgi:hypothetical protein